MIARLLLAPACAALLAISCAHAPSGGGAADSLRVNEAVELINAGDYTGAAAVLEPLVADNPRNAELLSMLGEARWRLGDYTAALACFESALRLDYGDYKTHLMLAQMLMENGKSGRALTEFELAVQYGDDRALPYYNYGLALYRLGRQEDALEQWRSAYRLEGGNPAYAAAMGIGLAGTDDREALSYFEQADALGENGHMFRHNFGLLLERLGEYGRAEEQFKRALDLAPGKRAYEFSLAALHMKTASYEKALPLLEELAAAEPDNRAYRTYQAKANLELGRFEAAAASLERLMEAWEREAVSSVSEPDAPPLDQALDILAMACRGTGDKEKSLAFIRKAVEIAPENTSHLNNYGVILADNGMIAEAITQWEKVLVLDPNNEIARQNLSARRGRK